MDFSKLNSHFQKLYYTTQAQIQSPCTILMSSSLTTLSTALQDFLKVKLPTGQIVLVSLGFITVADSGVGKTASDETFTKKIFEYEKKMFEADELLHARYQADLEIWKLKDRLAKKNLLKAANKKSDELFELEEAYRALQVDKPIIPLTNERIFMNATPEGLFEGMRKSKCGALFTSSEAGEMVTQLNTSFMSNINKSWGGELIKVNRKSSDCYTLQKPITYSFMLQKELFENFLLTKGEVARSSGFFARTLFSCPESTEGQRFFREPFTNYYLEDFNDRILELLELSSQYVEMNKIITLEFDREATTVWIQYSDALENEIGPLGRLHDIKDFASKLMNNVSRIAALLHFYEYGDKNGQPSIRQKIGVDTLKSAIEIGQYYLKQFRKQFGEKSLDEESRELAQILFTFFLNNYQPHNPTFEKNRLYSRTPRKIRTRDKLNIAIDRLILEGYLAYVPNSKPLLVTLTWKFINENNLPHYGANGF